MKRQRREGTEPELRVRRALTRLGQRYRLQASDLPGKPDLVNRARRWALFVHGCYWHQHPGCPRATVPTANREWWLAKFEANQRRDAAKLEALREAGFHVVVVWECETARADALDAILTERLDVRSTTARPSGLAFGRSTDP